MNVVYVRSICVGQRRRAGREPSESAAQRAAAIGVALLLLFSGCTLSTNPAQTNRRWTWDEADATRGGAKILSSCGAEAHLRPDPRPGLPWPAPL